MFILLCRCAYTILCVQSAYTLFMNKSWFTFVLKFMKKLNPHAKKIMMTYDLILWKSMATVNCLVTNILQNIFCVQQKTETHTGLEQLQGEQIFICGWTIPFKWLKYCSIGALYGSLLLFVFVFLLLRGDLIMCSLKQREIWLAFAAFL